MEGKSFWFFRSCAFPRLRRPPERMLLSFLLVIRPRRRSLPPPHLAGPRGARRQAAARRGSVGFVCSEFVSSSGHGALIVPRGTDTFPLLSDHRRHSGGDDVTHSANGKHVTPPGQSEQRTPGLGGWCDLGQVTPSELRYGEESESVSAGSGLRACEPSSP